MATETSDTLKTGVQNWRDFIIYAAKKHTLTSLNGSAEDVRLYCSHVQDACFLMTRLTNNNADAQIEKWFSHATNFDTNAYIKLLFFLYL